MAKSVHYQARCRFVQERSELYLYIITSNRNVNALFGTEVCLGLVILYKDLLLGLQIFRTSP